MKTNEMYFEFQTLLETVATEFADSERPDTDTVFRFLNLGYDSYIKQRYLSQPTAEENVAYIQRKADDLRKLISITSQPAIASMVGPSNRVMVELPSDYLFYIRSDSQISRTALPVASYAWVSNKVAGYEELNKITTGVYNAPILKEPIVIIKDEQFIIYTDSLTTLWEIQLTYLRKPKTLVLDIVDATTETDECELAFHTHNEIVQFAVNLYLTEYKFRLSRKAPPAPKEQ